MKPFRPLLAEPQSRVMGVRAASLESSQDVPDFDELFFRGFAPPGDVKRGKDPFVGKGFPASLTLYDYRYRRSWTLKECYDLTEAGRRCRDRRIILEGDMHVLSRRRKRDVPVDYDKRTLSDRRTWGEDDRRVSQVARRWNHIRHVDKLIWIVREQGRDHKATRLALRLMSEVVTNALSERGFEDWLSVWKREFWEQDWSYGENHGKYAVHAMLAFTNFIRQRGELSYQNVDDLKFASRLRGSFNQNHETFCWKLFTEEVLAEVCSCEGSQALADAIREGKEQRLQGERLRDFLIDAGFSEFEKFKAGWKNERTRDSFKKKVQRVQVNFPPVEVPTKKQVYP